MKFSWLRTFLFLCVKSSEATQLQLQTKIQKTLILAEYEELECLEVVKLSATFIYSNSVS